MSRPITTLFDKPWDPAPDKGASPLESFLNLLVFLVALPFLLIGVIIAGPITRRQRAKRRREIAKFEARMREAGRLMEWPDFAQQVESGKGTAIIERFSYKDGVRIWWTQDQLQASDEPHTELYPGCFDAPPCDFCLQVRDRYTSSAGGKAMLVSIPPVIPGEVRPVNDVIKRSRHVAINGRRPRPDAPD
jgi:hypothetical protein